MQVGTPSYSCFSHQKYSKMTMKPQDGIGMTNKHPRIVVLNRDQLLITVAYLATWLLVPPVDISVRGPRLTLVVQRMVARHFGHYSKYVIIAKEVVLGCFHPCKKDSFGELSMVNRHIA